MSGKLYLIRHGEVDSNHANMFVGSTDAELNEKGITQAQLLARRLRNTDIAAVYSSPMRRAIKTAEIIAVQCDLNVIPCPSLCELDYGDWEGVLEEVVRTVHAEDYNEWVRNSMEIPVPGGEKMGDLFDRAMPTFQKIAESHRDETVVIVAHKSVNRLILAGLLGMDLNRYRQLGQVNTCLNQISFRKDGSFVVDTINDQGHLLDL